MASFPLLLFLAFLLIGWFGAIVNFALWDVNIYNLYISIIWINIKWWFYFSFKVWFKQIPIFDIQGGFNSAKAIMQDTGIIYIKRDAYGLYIIDIARLLYPNSLSCLNSGYTQQVVLTILWAQEWIFNVYIHYKHHCFSIILILKWDLQLYMYIQRWFYIFSLKCGFYMYKYKVVFFLIVFIIL